MVIVKNYLRLHGLDTKFFLHVWKVYGSHGKIGDFNIGRNANNYSDSCISDRYRN